MAIDAKKIQNNDELIAKFYTLRAGLSVIADETQKIKVSEKELSDLKIKNDKNNSDINERKNNTIYKLTYSINQQKLLIEELDKNIEKSKSHKAGMSKFWIPVLITCFAYLMILSFMLALDLNSEGFIRGDCRITGLADAPYHQSGCA